MYYILDKEKAKKKWIIQVDCLVEGCKGNAYPNIEWEKVKYCDKHLLIGKRKEKLKQIEKCQTEDQKQWVVVISAEINTSLKIKE